MYQWKLIEYNWGFILNVLRANQSLYLLTRKIIQTSLFNSTIYCGLLRLHNKIDRLYIMRFKK